MSSTHLQDDSIDGGVPGVAIGLRANLGQFALLVLVNGFVGAMVGVERAALPVLAVHQFHLAAAGAALSFIVSFGLVKGLANLAAGRLSESVGRKTVLVTGWLLGVPVPLIVLWAPSWSWVVAANALLGVNQGLCWSMTVNMKIDLVGAAHRGMALGLNETAGYASLGLAALASAPLATEFGLRNGPFGLALLIGLMGLLVSVIGIRDTRHHVQAEARLDSVPARLSEGILSWRTWSNRDLLACSQAGLVNNLNDAAVWGVLPIFLLAHGLDLSAIALIASAYALSWGVLQPLTGVVSDRWGRRSMIVSGMLIQGLALAGIPWLPSATWWLAAALMLGAGTALVYPTLLAAVGDLADPCRRASSLGVYRLWRDLGYAVGAILAGKLADVAGIPASITVIAVLTLSSGLIAGLALRETAPATAAARP